MLEHVVWKPVPGNQSYAFKFNVDEAGYAVMVTDMHHIWSCECRDQDDLRDAMHTYARAFEPNDPTHFSVYTSPHDPARLLLEAHRITSGLTFKWHFECRITNEKHLHYTHVAAPHMLMLDEYERRIKVLATVIKSRDHKIRNLSDGSTIPHAPRLAVFSLDEFDKEQDQVFINSLRDMTFDTYTHQFLGNKKHENMYKLASKVIFPDAETDPEPTDETQVTESAQRAAQTLDLTGIASPNYLLSGSSNAGLTQQAGEQGLSKEELKERKRQEELARRELCEDYLSQKPTPKKKRKLFK
ncbi:hypothetical protein SeMB42_g00961 [Synchytrium endobioticum]|uniref:Non-homologous end-joining factor 1 n=1 Tax=Synchytrium endobioticum TaxID=286115 RepID=A0A507DNR4_9FUNG|nr:hypothetical protein SeMB42_g00961 [Synchytrium endobioticum]